MQEQEPQQYYGSFNRQSVGTTFEHGNQIDLHASELELLEARADIDAATKTQPLEELVQKRLEHEPLLPQEVIKMIGQKVVFDLRKGYNETHINLTEDVAIDASAPYIYSPETDQVSQPATAQLYQFPAGEEARTDNATTRADAA